MPRFHAGSGLFSVRLDDETLVLIPCSTLVRAFYAPVFRRDMRILFGEAPRDAPMCFNGFTFQEVSEGGYYA